MNKLEIEKISFREAISFDSELLFELSNDLEVRKNSINPLEIKWEEHVKWFENKISDENYLIFVFFYNLEFLGQVKFSIENVEATISISIHKKFRGLGAAKILLKKGITNLIEKNLKINTIFAFIKPINLASIKSFESVGFVYLETIKIKNKTFNKYKYKVIPK